MTDQQPLRIEIRPKPSDEEAAAITAAVLAISGGSSDSAEPYPPRDRWREAGKAEALRSGPGEAVTRDWEIR